MGNRDHSLTTTDTISCLGYSNNLYLTQHIKKINKYVCIYIKRDHLANIVLKIILKKLSGTEDINFYL